MNGVEILAIEEVVSTYTCNWMAVWIATCLVFAFTMIVGILLCIREHQMRYLIVFLFVALFVAWLLGFIPMFGLTMTPTAYETRYKVTISDEVSMNEFLDKYEIIDQEGKIYTVRERE